MNARELPTTGSRGADSPWADLDADGSTLTVDDFITTVVNRAASALRRTVTAPYSERFGVTVSEWRMLSVLAQSREMSFAELVVQSVTDKAQVSRTLRVMQERGLVQMLSEGNPRWNQLRVRITPGGMALYRKVMPVARRHQAAMILQLSKAERVATYRALNKLCELCEKVVDEDIAE